MIQIRLLPAMSLLCLFALPDPAAACSSSPRHDSARQVSRLAREIFERSSAIIDAMVVVTNDGTGGIAQLRPIRVLKGPHLPIYRVRYSGSCDIAFVTRGDRVRAILTGGPNVFNASQEDHGFDYFDSDNGARLMAAIDRLTGVPRPRGVHVAGWEGPPPVLRRRVTRRR